MLLYHPFFDAHHCAFRMLRLLESISGQVESERLRIWDFYLLSPSHLAEAELPRGTTGIRTIVRLMANRYDVLPNARRAFIRLEPIQVAALAHLASVGLIEAKSLKDGIVQRTALPIPEALLPLILERNQSESTVILFLTGPFLRTPLHGKGGLRTRTDLFDHRYDIP